MMISLGLVAPLWLEAEVRAGAFGESSQVILIGFQLLLGDPCLKTEVLKENRQCRWLPKAISARCHYYLQHRIDLGSLSSLLMIVSAFQVDVPIRRCNFHCKLINWCFCFPHWALVNLVKRYFLESHSHSLCTNKEKKKSWATVNSTKVKAHVSLSAWSLLEPSF